MKTSKLTIAIEAMREEVPTLRCPSHLTIADLEEINEKIDTNPTLYQMGVIIRQLAVKPPQTVRFMSVSKFEFNRETMFDWRANGSSYFVEVRVDDADGSYLNIINWEQLTRTNEECLRLMGIRDA